MKKCKVCGALLLGRAPGTENESEAEEKPDVINDAGDYEDFLQDACLKLHDDWIAAGGPELTPEQLQLLNGVLDTFFGDMT